MIFRTAVYEVRMGIYSAPGGSGVRGAPHRLQAVRPPTRLAPVLVGVNLLPLSIVGLLPNLRQLKASEFRNQMAK